MAKLTLNNIGNAGSSGITQINANNDLIEAALENTLSRDGTSPNQMNADLDMNNNDILNVKVIQADDITVDGGSVQGILERSLEAVEDAELAADISEAWAQSPTPIPVEYGGDGSTDYSAKHWAEIASAISIPDGGISTAKLADGSVTTVKIADNNVTTAKIANGNVTEAKLETALAASIVPKDSSTTINVPTDYSTVQEAIEAASKMRFKAGRIPIINIESGFTWSEHLDLLNTHFSGLTIISEDDIIYLNDDFPKIFPAARWDGSGTRSRRTSALAGVSDGKKGIVSFWAKFNGGDGVTQPLIVGRSGADIAFTVRRASDNKWYVQGRSTPAGTLVLSMASNSAWNVADGWHHVMASWDLATGQAQMYINGVDDRAASPTVTNTAIDYTLSDWGFGCEPASAADPNPTFNGDLAEVYINLAESIDLSILSNRQKFIQDTGAPEVLGWRATRPTGNRPALWFNGVFQSFRTNFGTGGAFVNSGNFTPSPTYPDGTPEGVDDSDGAKILSLENCTGIIWDILIDGNGHAFQGMDIYNSNIKIGSGAGIKNCLEDNIEANKGSTVIARDSIFSGAGYRGIQADGSSYIDAVGANVNESFWGVNAQNTSRVDASPEGSSDSPLSAIGCYDRAVIADELSRVTLWQADLTDCGGTYCVEIQSGATVYMEAARTNNSGALVGFFYKPSLTDVNVAAFNTLYHNGILFSPTWDS